MFVRWPILRIILVILTAFLVSSCDSPVRFSAAALDEYGDPPLLPFDPDRPQPAPTPTPPPTPAPELPPSYEVIKGNCASDASTNLLSCMKCDVPQTPPPPPQLSRKGQELLDTMAAGCAIGNKSDPRNYQAPSRAELLNRLQQCSPTLYPDTSFKGTQKSTVAGLTSDDDYVRRKIFSGIFYTLPWAEDFATYFGLDVVEARYLFCYRSGSLPPVMYPREYYDAFDPFEFVMPPLYVEANQIRRNLINCMEESLRNPYVPPTPQPGASCDFESMSGPHGDAVFTQVAIWLSQGYKVGYENPDRGLCMKIEMASELPDIEGSVKVAAYKCQP